MNLKSQGRIGEEQRGRNESEESGLSKGKNEIPCSLKLLVEYLHIVGKMKALEDKGEENGSGKGEGEVT